MLDLLYGAVIALIVAVIAVFLGLLGVNIALARKLRSIIPTSPHARPAHSDKMAANKPQLAHRSA